MLFGDTSVVNLSLSCFAPFAGSLLIELQAIQRSNARIGNSLRIMDIEDLGVDLSGSRRQTYPTC